MSAEADRQNKIIVALFLILGKATSQLNAAQRQSLSVTESEIRKAWADQKSPVRIISEVRNEWSTMSSGDNWGSERTFRVVVGELDLKKTGMDLRRKMPEEPKIKDPLKPGKRCFDLE